MVQKENSQNANDKLVKARTGICGFDQITHGGLPNGRPTLIAGGPGCGKTVFGMQFLVSGAAQYNEPGIFVTFEVSPEHLQQDFRSMKVPLNEMIDEGKIKFSHIDLGEAEILEAGDFTLDALKLRLKAAIRSIGAKRIVLDTMENLYSILPESTVLRREIGKFFEWIRQQGLTAVITGELGEYSLTQQGFEAYVSDCVVFLDHRITEQISKRRLRVVKYRGSEHGEDEYPFVISERGISVFPITSTTLTHTAPKERLSTGLKSLDAMFDGQGYFRNSAILVAGKAGTGKSTLSAVFAKAACERGEDVLYLAFEESPSQIIRNMRSVGVDMQYCVDSGRMIIRAFRPTLRGLEEHLISFNQTIRDIDPNVVIMDPITSFIDIGSPIEVKSMLARVLDSLKSQNITSMMTVLTSGLESPEETEVGVSSLMDTWVALDYVMHGQDRQRAIYVVKSRGMDHSTEKRRLKISSKGVTVQDF